MPGAKKVTAQLHQRLEVWKLTDLRWSTKMRLLSIRSHSLVYSLLGWMLSATASAEVVLRPLGGPANRGPSLIANAGSDQLDGGKPAGWVSHLSADFAVGTKIEVSVPLASGECEVVRLIP
jgi:hypothetical protein